jgi:hypothetical protein
MATALGIVLAENASVEAAILNAGTVAALDAALASAQPGDTIVLTNDITLTANLVNTATTNITINGNNHTLSGAGSFRGLSAQSLTNGGINVTIENLTIENSKVQGGNGGFGGKDGGGGGAGGIGGGLGIGSRVNLTLSNVNLVSNIAQGVTVAPAAKPEAT